MKGSAVALFKGFFTEVICYNQVMKDGKGKPPIGTWKLLVNARELKNHNQTEAGLLFEVTQDTWSRWERCETAPNVSVWRKLARYCGLSVEQLAVSIAENFAYQYGF